MTQSSVNIANTTPSGGATPNAAVRRLWSVDEAARQLGIGRTSLYKLIAEDRLRSVMIAGRRLIPEAELARITSA